MVVHGPKLGLSFLICAIQSNPSFGSRLVYIRRLHAKREKSYQTVIDKLSFLCEKLTTMTDDDG